MKVREINIQTEQPTDKERLNEKCKLIDKERHDRTEKQTETTQIMNARERHRQTEETTDKVRQNEKH